MAVYKQEEGDHSGFCFSCSAYVANPYGDNPPPSEASSVVTNNNGSFFDEIFTFPITEDQSRKVTKATRQHFDVRSELSTQDGKTLVATYYPYTKGGEIKAWKKRTLPKDFTAIGDFKQPELFGMRQAKSSGSRKLYITEGEEDALALYQVLKDNSKGTQWASMEPAVVSIPNGSSSAVRDVGRFTDFVRLFESVVLCLDQDGPGQEATESLTKLFPNALVAVLSEKDASDMLVKGKGNELAKACLFNAKKHKPASVVSVADAFERAIAMPVMGIPWPWPTLTKLTYGIKRKSIYGLGAGVGIGKTDFAKELQSWLVNRQGLSVGAVMLEESVGRTLKGIAGKFYGKQFHKPDGSFTQEELEKAIRGLEGKVFLYDHFGIKNWEDVKAAIRYMVVSEGIKDIFLDPLTALVSHLSSGEANDALNTIMGDLAGLTHELDFTCYYFAHLNPPQSGPAHERGGKVHEGQFTGSRAMMRWSQYLFGLERNKDPELPEDERNTAQFVLLKDRDYGEVGRFPIYYNKVTGTFLEPEGYYVGKV